MGMASNQLAPFYLIGARFSYFHCCHLSASLQFSSREQSPIKPFFRIIPNSVPNPMAELVVVVVNLRVRADRPLQVQSLRVAFC
jgi:hypothetical protein